MEKAKIINVKVNTPFKEVKKEKPKEEKKQERLEDEFDDDSYSDFSAKSRTAPVLESSNQSQTIEQQVASAPSAPTTSKNGRNYEEITKVYNMPDYGGPKLYENENRIQEERVRVGTIPTPLGAMGMNLRQLRQQDFTNYPGGERRQQQEEMVRQYEPQKPKEELRRTAGRRQ